MGGGQLLSGRMKTLKRSGCPGRASAQLGRHCGPHNTVRTRSTGDPRVVFGGVTCKKPWRCNDREGATNTLGGGLTTSPTAHGPRAVGEPWVGPSG